MIAEHGSAWLGKTVKDKITGFKGVVTGHVVYISGCNQALVVGQAKDGKPADSMWIDEQRLEAVPRVKRVVLDNGETPGCDLAAPVR